MTYQLTKLIIKHLPQFFNQEDTISFLKSFGSIDVVTFDNKKGKMRYCAFATFADESSTWIALRNLHQLELFGTRLVVEFAKDKNLIVHPNDEKDEKLKKNEFFTQLHFISSKFNINYPISPLIKYNYPPASSSIIRNIAKALHNNSNFYTQVLHLMNKMNLPPPFINSDYEFDEQLLPKNFNCKIVELNSESSESELEDKRIDQLNNDNQILNKLKKRKIKKSIQEASKRLKTKEIKLIHNDERLVEYFDNYSQLKSNKINCILKLNDRMMKSNDNQSNQKINQDAFGKLSKLETSKEDNQKLIEQKNSNLKSINSLFERQLNLDELKNYSIFDNYSIGESSCRLYIKNVDKKITEEQLRLIFINLLNLNEIEINTLNVNLFKKGKMNGQAFVCLSNEQLAKEAINKTNGLLINNKPICVCYARSIKAKN